MEPQAQAGQSTLDYINDLMTTLSKCPSDTTLDQCKKEKEECSQRLKLILMETDTLNTIINVIVQKSVSDPNVRLLGAQLCNYLSEKDNLGDTFGQLLANKCDKAVNELLYRTPLDQVCDVIYFYCELLENPFKSIMFARTVSVMLGFLVNLDTVSNSQLECFEEVLVKVLDVVVDEDNKDLNSDLDLVMWKLQQMLSDETFNDRRKEEFLGLIDDEMKLKGKMEVKCYHNKYTKWIFLAKYFVDLRSGRATPEMDSVLSAIIAQGSENEDSQ